MLTPEDIELLKKVFPTKDYLDEKFTKELEPVKRDIRMLKRDFKTMIRFFDNDITSTRKRVDRIEDRLRAEGIP